VIPVEVSAALPLAEGVRLLELVPRDRAALPGFAAGDHVDVELAPGVLRSYSLTDAPEPAPARYRLAVALAAQGRGGSRLAHTLPEGARLRVSTPLGGFGLREDAEHTVLIAGGIGITPLMSMLRRLTRLARPWELHYAVGSRRAAAFLPQLERAAGQVRCYVSQEAGPRPMPVAALLDRAPLGAHLYCCGPEPLLEDFLAATAGRRPDQVHLERFHASRDPGSGAQAGSRAAEEREGELEVELASAGRTVQVAPGQTILDALLDAGIDVPFSCMEGICGSCRTKVLDGVTRHRDSAHSPAERAAGDSILICCSGTEGGRIVLDL
jgi:ferredoxin-NADP reductase